MRSGYRASFRSGLPYEVDFLPKSLISADNVYLLQNRLSL